MSLMYVVDVRDILRRHTGLVSGSNCTEFWEINITLLVLTFQDSLGKVEKQMEGGNEIDSMRTEGIPGREMAKLQY